MEEFEHYKLEELYDKVVDVINAKYDYHCNWICISNSAQWFSNYVTFDVKGWSDQGYGSEWTEYWEVCLDGRICRDGEWFNSFEDFKNNF